MDLNWAAVFPLATYLHLAHFVPSLEPATLRSTTATVPLSSGRRAGLSTQLGILKQFPSTLPPYAFLLFPRPTSLSGVGAGWNGGGGRVCMCVWGTILSFTWAFSGSKPGF